MNPSLKTVDVNCYIPYDHTQAVYREWSKQAENHVIVKGYVVYVAWKAF